MGAGSGRPCQCSTWARTYSTATRSRSLARPWGRRRHGPASSALSEWIAAVEPWLLGAPGGPQRADRAGAAGRIGRSAQASNGVSTSARPVSRPAARPWGSLVPRKPPPVLRTGQALEKTARSGAAVADYG